MAAVLVAFLLFLYSANVRLAAEVARLELELEAEVTKKSSINRLLKTSVEGCNARLQGCLAELAEFKDAQAK